jgi:hypothetical protein
MLSAFSGTYARCQSDLQIFHFNIIHALFCASQNRYFCYVCNVAGLVDVDVDVDWGRGHGATTPLHLRL